MKIAVWKTGHQIADTVVDNFVDYERYSCGSYTSYFTTCRFEDLPVYNSKAHIGYGILRGMSGIFNACDRLNKPWFNIDNGYMGAGHFHGFYRISYRGTQARWHDGIPEIPHGILFEEWKKTGDRFLIAPPSDHVCGFFNVDKTKWLADNQVENSFIREKSDNTLIDWSKIKGVITFNSTIGVEALKRGIPVISDIQHSIIGSYYKYHLIDKGLDYNFDNVMEVSRDSLFNGMRGHQFTLTQIRNGDAWSLINHYLNT